MTWPALTEGLKQRENGQTSPDEEKGGDKSDYTDAASAEKDNTTGDMGEKEVRYGY